LHAVDGGAAKRHPIARHRLRCTSSLVDHLFCSFCPGSGCAEDNGGQGYSSALAGELLGGRRGCMPVECGH
jgi:hypothetical protein